MSFFHPHSPSTTSPPVRVRLAVYSDLHTEFADWTPPAAINDVDVVVLAGDIGVRMQGLAWAIDAFPRTPVVYVCGNHEFYGASTPRLITKLKQKAAGTNVVVLDADRIDIAGVRFLGATLWTDFCLFGREKRDQHGEIARDRMNDFRRIRVSPTFSRLTPRAVSAFHARARAWLTTELGQPFSGPTVVVSHHAPMLASVPPAFRHDPLSAAYASDLTALLDGRADLWIHGHTHFAVDTWFGGTRIVSNQRGYPDEPAVGFQPACIVEVDLKSELKTEHRTQ